MISKVVTAGSCHLVCMEHPSHIRSEIVGPWLCEYHRVVRSVLDRARSSRHFWRAVETQREDVKPSPRYTLAVYRNHQLEYVFSYSYYTAYVLYDARTAKTVRLRLEDGWAVAKRAKADCLRAARQEGFEVRSRSRKPTTASLPMPWNVLEVEA